MMRARTKMVLALSVVAFVLCLVMGGREPQRPLFNKMTPIEQALTQRFDRAYEDLTHAHMLDLSALEPGAPVWRRMTNFTHIEKSAFCELYNATDVAMEVLKINATDLPYVMKHRATDVLETYLDFTGAVLHSDRGMLPNWCDVEGEERAARMGMPQLVYQALRIMDGPPHHDAELSSLGFGSFGEFHAAVQRHMHKLLPAEQQWAVEMQLIAKR